MAPDPPALEDYPAACRKILMEYSKHVQSLGQTLFSLLSEALGLNPAYLTDIWCTEGHAFVCHYYPACPEPDRTLGFTKNTVILTSSQSFYKIELEASKFFMMITGLMSLHWKELL